MFTPPKNSGPITKNGIHPITGKLTTIERAPENGKPNESPPKASMVTAKGANPGGPGGKKGPAKVDVLPQKTMAEMLYPKSVGMKQSEK
jgi:hypothetical protein